jgi:hypothetical protein
LVCLARRRGDGDDVIRRGGFADGETLLGSPLHADPPRPPAPSSAPPPPSRESSVDHSPLPPPSPAVARFSGDSPVFRAGPRKSTVSRTRLGRAFSDLPSPPSPSKATGCHPEDCRDAPRSPSFGALRMLSSRSARPADLLLDDDDDDDDDS